MEKIIFVSICFLVSVIGFPQTPTDADAFADTITKKELESLLSVYASDEFQGREAGTDGEQKALKFLKKHYKKMHVSAAKGKNDYFQKVDIPRFKNSYNVVAYIKGSEKPQEYVYISAHLDHIGVDSNGKINNGADDDGSGTVALLEIAEAFKKAQKKGLGPKRSVVFLHVTGEEKGLLGSEYYTQNPIFPLDGAVADLNIDMIGRTDPKRKGSREYVYLIGSDKLSTDLHKLSEQVNSSCCNLELDYTFNDENDPNRFYYRSDHYNFAKHNIPIIFYFNGVHADYHQPTDTVDKIQFDLLAKRARLVFYTAWEIANRNSRLVVDKASKN